MRNEDYIFPDEAIHKTIERFEDLVRIVATKYSRNSQLFPYTQNDLSQYIVLRLIENIKSVKANYRGEARLKTYMSAVIRNYSLEFIRKNKPKSVEFISIDNYSIDQNSDIAIQPLKDVQWLVEITRLERILKLYGSKRSKIEVVFKGVFRIKVLPPDLFYQPNYHEYESPILKFIAKINTHTNLNSGEIFTLYTHLFNLLESKNNSDEAIRKWTLRTMEEIIKLLNDCVEKRHYTKESLGALFNLYFENRNSKNES